MVFCLHALQFWRARRAQLKRHRGVYKYSDDDRYIMFPVKEPSGLFAYGRWRNTVYALCLVSESVLLFFTVPLIYWIGTRSWILGVIFLALCGPLLWMRAPYYKQLAAVKNRHSNAWHNRQARRVLIAIAAHGNQVMFVMSACLALGFFDSDNYPHACTQRLARAHDDNSSWERLMFTVCGLTASSSEDDRELQLMARCRMFLFLQFIALLITCLLLTVSYQLHYERSLTLLSRSLKSFPAQEYLFDGSSSADGPAANTPPNQTPPFPPLPSNLGPPVPFRPGVQRWAANYWQETVRFIDEDMITSENDDGVVEDVTEEGSAEDGGKAARRLEAAAALIGKTDAAYSDSASTNYTRAEPIYATFDVEAVRNLASGLPAVNAVARTSEYGVMPY